MTNDRTKEKPNELQKENTNENTTDRRN